MITTEAYKSKLASAEALVRTAYRVMFPPEKLTLSQWADKKRKLSSKNAAEPGDWHTDRNPALRAVMDACTDPAVSEVSFMAAAQIGKTESVINNTVGYFMDQDPSAILAVFESEEKAEAWSKERLAPMLIDTPCLADKVRTGKGPDSANTIQFKDFSGGTLAIAGAGSEADLSSRPIRVLLKDEVDKWKIIKAGDPDALADKRTSTYFNRKIINCSTPRELETSRIWKKYQASNQQDYYVPCPFCGHEQTLREEQLKFTRPGDIGEKTEAVWYECEKCGWKIDQRQKRGMLAKGRWIAARPFAGHAGFRLSALYSPWVSWKEYAEAFLRMKRQRDTFKTFVNEWRGEPWAEDLAHARELSPYLTRREKYEEVPLAAAYLTAGVDVQGDRIEVEVKAWGVGRESWGVDHVIFWGEPRTGDPGKLAEVWTRLDAYLQQTWPHESGALLPIMCCLIDSGNWTTEVYRFCKPRRSRNIFPCKGVGGGRELVGRASANNRERVKFFPVGTNAAKDIVFGNLDTAEPGPGFMHFNQSFDADYFKQLLTSERPKWIKGVKVYEKVSASARNEALDLNVYNLAAFDLLRVNPEARVAELRKQYEEKQQGQKRQDPEKQEPPRPIPAPARMPGRGNFATRWKR